MRAPGARLRPVPLPARESRNPHASSARVQHNSISGACTLPSRSLVLARPGLTWMHRCEALNRKSSSFTMMGQDERGHGIGRRGHVCPKSKRDVWTAHTHEADLDWSRQCSDHLLAAMHKNFQKKGRSTGGQGGGFLLVPYPPL